MNEAVFKGDMVLKIELSVECPASCIDASNIPLGMCMTSRLQINP